MDQFLSIPILVYLFHIDVVLASAYSLFIVGVTSLVGAIPKYKEHLVNIKTGICCLEFLPFSAFSLHENGLFMSSRILFCKLIRSSLRNVLLLLGLFAILMVLASVSMIRERQEVKSEERPFQNHVGNSGGYPDWISNRISRRWWWISNHSCTGIAYRFELSKLPLVLPSLLSPSIHCQALLGDLFNYTMDWPFLLSITGLGCQWNPNWEHDYPINFLQPILRKLFGWFVLIMGCWILLKETVL